MDISNSCDRIDRLVSVTSEAAKTVVLHATEETSAGVAAMKQIEGGIELPAYGETVRLSPGGFHVMLMGLTEHPSETERMSFTLHFESGTELQVLAGLTFEPHRPAPINPGGNGD